MTEQDPKTGAFPWADEANKWGELYRQFVQSRMEARNLSDPNDRAALCEPPYEALIGEFWYVWKDDAEFCALYEEIGGVRPGQLFAGTPAVDAMQEVLAVLKGVVARRCKLWGYDKVGDAEPYSIVPIVNGGRVAT